MFLLAGLLGAQPAFPARDGASGAPRVSSDATRRAAPGGLFLPLSLDQALAKAAEQRRVVLVDFYTTWCGPCKLLDSTTWRDGKVVALLEQEAIPLKIDAEKEAALSRKYAVDAYPTILLLKPDGSVLDRMVGYQKPEAFIVSFQGALKGITSLDRARKAVADVGTDDLKGQVDARQNLARVLMQQGRDEEALKELLWLYDDGMKRNPSSRGVRNSFLLLDWARLGRDYPPALASLRQHREAAQRQFLASPEDVSVALDLTSLNHALKEDQATLGTFDQLPPGSPGRKLLGSAVWDLLMAQRRYADALKVRSSGDLLGEIARQESLLPKDPTIQKIFQARWLELAASGLEALVAVGRLEEAKPLVKKALAIDPSAGTRRLLEVHLQRSGHPVPLDSLE
ncbi:MAG TPA: thioredoxin domain-containing protein [Holophagaceae bacterium]